MSQTAFREMFNKKKPQSQENLIASTRQDYTVPDKEDAPPLNQCSVCAFI